MFEEPWLCACKITKARKGGWKQKGARGNIKVQASLELNQSY